MLKRGIKVYAYTTGCAINIGEIEAERIVFIGSILALKILDEVHKNAKYDEYEE